MSQVLSSTQTKLALVEEMVRQLMNQNWPAFLTYFHKDLFYKVGVAEPVHGPEACRDFLANIYTRLQLTHHVVRLMAEFDNAVIVEMDAHYKVIEDGRELVVPCCDVYRFEDGLIKEWRVYADASNVGVQF